MSTLAARTFRGSKSGAGGGTPKTTPDTLRSQDTVELVLAISEGPIKGLVNGPKSFHVGDTALRAANGDSNFDAFTLNEFHGQPGERITFTLGGQAGPVIVNQQLHKDIAVTRTGNATHINFIDVRLFIQQLYENQHSGDVDVTNLTFEIFHKPTAGSTWTSSFGGQLRIRGKETGAGYAKEFRFPVADIAGTYDVQVVLYDPPDNDQNHHAVVSWDSFAQIVTGAWTWPGLAYTQVVARGNDQFTSVPQFWGEYDGRIVKIPSVMTQVDPSARTYSAGVWDGTYVLGWTDDPAWIAKDIVENTTYGLAKYTPGLTLDPADALVASKWWSTPVSDGSGGQHPRFSMNLLLDEGKSGPQALAYVVGACGGVCFEGDAGVIRLQVDRPTAPVHLFTKENTVGDFEYSWSDWQTRYNDVTVSFNNKFLDYRTETRRVTIDAHVAKYGPIPLQITAVGCAHPQEAIRRARHRAVTATTECQTVTLRTNRLGQAVLPYDLILVGDPDLGYGVTGRVTGLLPGFSNRFTLRDPIPVAVGVAYQVKWQVPDGLGGYQVVTTALASTQPTGLPTQLWLSGGAPAGLPEYAVFELERTTGAAIAKPFRAMRVVEVDGSPDLYEITALEVNLNKWSYIDDGATIVVVNYGFPPGDPDPPTALAAVVGTRTVSGNTVADLQISWTASVSPSVSRYEVSYRLNGGAAQLLTSTGDTFADLVSPLPGTYEIEVVALSISQQRSISAKTTIRVADTGRTVQPPANLRVKAVGGTSFAGRDLTFAWDQPVPESMFRDYVVQVMNGASVLRTQRVSVGEFLYTFDMNAADHGGVPSRTVQVQVQTEDVGLNLSVAVQQTFANPAPAAPANATALATVNAVAVQLDPSPDPDVTAYQVYASTVSGFTPDPSNLVYQGLNNTPLIKVAIGTVMYFRAACVDAFGPGPFTAEISASSVDSQIADASVTSQKLADGAVTMPKIAPRSVATSALAVGDFTNLALNGDFGAGLDGWTFSPTLTGETRAVLATGLPAAPTDWAVPQALQLAATGVSASGWAGFQGQIQVTPGDQYYVSALFAGVAGALGAVTVRWTMADGTVQDADGPNPVNAEVPLQPGAFDQAWDVFTAPPLAKYATLRPRIRNNAPAGTYWVALGTLRHMTPSVLIQDGAVVAEKIVAGAIQTDHLAAGAVSADKIQAGSITADKIAIGDFNNLIPDPQFEHGGSWNLPPEWVIVVRDDPGVPVDAPTASVLRIPANNGVVAALPLVSVTTPPTDVNPSAGSPTTETVAFARSGNLTQVASVPWSVQGTGPNPVLASDFVGGILPSGTVAFAAGASAGNATFQIAAEAAPASDKTGAFVVGAPSGATLSGASTFAFKLTAAAALPTVAVTTAPVDVRPSVAAAVTETLAFTRSGSLAGASTLPWSVQGTGTNPVVAADFVGGVLPSGTASFAAGAASASGSFQVAAKAAPATGKTGALVLGTPTGATIAGAASFPFNLTAAVAGPNPYALGPDWTVNWVRHRAAGADSATTQGPDKATLTGGTVAASLPDQHNSLALWSKRRKVGDGRAVFTTRLVDTTSPASSALTEEMFGFYFGMSGTGSAATPWWIIPGGNRSGRKWNRGVSITAWTQPNWGKYETQVSPIDVLVAPSDNAGKRCPDWPGLAGGPLHLTNLAAYDDPLAIQPNSVLDWDGSSNLGLLIRLATPGKTLIVWQTITIPTSLTVANAASTTWHTLASPGAHDDYWYAMGRRARAAMVLAGMRPWQLSVRFNHEMNQSNFYQLFAGQQADYALAAGRFMTAFRAGYAAVAGDVVRMIFSPARRLDIGPLEDFFTVNADGTTPYDAVDVSAHPQAELNFTETQSYAAQVQAMTDWLTGAYRPGYAANHTDPTKSQIVLARKYGIPICYTEWSPRYTEHDATGAVTLEGCHVGAAVVDGMHQWLAARAAAGELAFDAIFHGNILDPAVNTPNWSAMVTKFTSLWHGDVGAPTVPATPYPADLTAWAATTEPYTHTYRDKCTGAALFFYYQPDANPVLGRVLTLRVYKGDGSANPVAGTTVFPNAQGVTYTWTVAWSGNTVQVTCTDGVTTWNDSITSPLMAANADTGNVGLLVSPRRVVEVGDITLTDAGP